MAAPTPMRATEEIDLYGTRTDITNPKQVDYITNSWCLYSYIFCTQIQEV